ncbi:MAG: hypothetical protein FJ096_14090 [Deltaproteobacteria bacterium]|nr:hypothetical protein [Deltaproteobacteria bacterium]
MRSTHLGLIVAVAASLLGLGGGVRAQGARVATGKPDPATQAANLAKEGRALLAKGQLDAGCAKLDESVRESAKSAVAVELATCLEKQGKHALAYQALDTAIAAAQREKASSQESSARAKQKTLEKQVVMVRVTVTDATATLTLNGSPLEAARLASPLVLEPGSHTLVANAEGKKPWEWKQDLQAGQREAVTVPELEALPPPPGPVAADGPSHAPEAEARRGTPFAEQSSRFFVELGVVGGLLRADVPTAESSGLDGIAYTFPGPSGGTVFAACGDRVTVPGAGVCSGGFGPATNALVGGQVFAGWVLNPRMHVGLRTFVAASAPGGLFMAAGPALSVRAFGPLWLGLGGVVGYERHQSRLVSATGTAPVATGVVDVPVGGKSGLTLPVDSGVTGGGTLEVALSIFGAEHPGATAMRTRSRLLSGSLLVGIWPSVLAGGGTTTITVPGGVSYRFH